jgi:hypothetical protein
VLVAQRQHPLLQILECRIRFFCEIFFVDHARRITDFEFRSVFRQ